ncbi:MAG: ABC transporter ATP-binding protein [Bacteroidetes bacterium]|nr:ABC transporter ATP-binding protein [Bacteroidota bacterium]MBS1629482.1 ABC transporter ATP-binding protein [Bacteroidota bacterium]
MYVEKLCKSYPGASVPALDGLSLSVPYSEIFGLLGPNGAGKTTTIKILCGLIPADSGTATLFGLNAQQNMPAIKGKLGLVPQHIALYPALTGLENLRYLGRLYNLSETQIRQRSKNLMERLGLEAHADKRVSRYSGGMKRRLNIIASLLHEPELLILDEPTASVDVHSRALILSFLEECRSQGKTIVYTSHQMEEAEQICDTVCIVDEGKMVAQGSPQELISTTSGCRRLEDVFLYHTGHSLRD